MLKITIFILGLAVIFSGGLAIADENEVGKAQAMACAGCHGANGNSPNPQWPSLAGQRTEYLSSQIRAFRDGKRKSEAMKSVVAKLTDIDAENLAEYFSRQQPKSAGGDVELAMEGKSKYVVCAGCHGKQAEGLGIGPRLAGQHPGYVVAQLENFKSGVRDNAVMQPMTSNLSQAEFEALAAYIGTLE